MESGACFSIWLKRTLTHQEKSLLKEYENYLMKYKGFSFIYEIRIPVITKHEEKQLLNTIGYLPDEEISISGLATPLFRAIEAILKYFGGYAKIGASNYPNLKGECYEIRKSNIYFPHLLGNKYYLSDWEIIANEYNLDDTPEIKETYSIQNFINTRDQGKE